MTRRNKLDDAIALTRAAGAQTATPPWDRAAQPARQPCWARIRAAAASRWRCVPRSAVAMGGVWMGAGAALAPRLLDSPIAGVAGVGLVGLATVYVVGGAIAAGTTWGRR